MRSSSKQASFFEHWGRKRVYFYEVDLRGRLFPQANLDRRNEATCLKSVKFLNFFFSRVRPTASLDQKHHGTLVEEFKAEYPWASPCGKEMNLVQADDTPIVLRDVVSKDNQDLLVYAGDLTVPFEPDNVVLGLETQRLYYRSHLGLFLFRADLAQRLLETYSPSDNTFAWKGRKHEISSQCM